jgi:hypothetical protein
MFVIYRVEVVQSIQQTPTGSEVHGSNPGRAPVNFEPGTHSASGGVCTGSLYLGKSGRGVELTTHPNLVSRLTL